MRTFLSWLIRIGLLAVVVVLGFTVVFPEWFDMKDQLAAERREEAAREQARARGELSTQAADRQKAHKLELASDARGLADSLWLAVDSGDASAVWSRGSAEFQERNPSPAFQSRMQSVLDIVGARRADAASEKNYSEEAVVADNMPMFLDVETQYWGEHAMCKRTLRFKQKGDRLEVDTVILYVLLYPGKEDRVPRSMMGPNIF